LFFFKYVGLVNSMYNTFIIIIIQVKRIISSDTEEEAIVENPLPSSMRTTRTPLESDSCVQIVAILWHFGANECSCPPPTPFIPITHPQLKMHPLQFREQFSLTILNVHKHIKMIIKRKFRSLFIFRTSAAKLMLQCCICIIYLLCMQMHLIAWRSETETAEGR